ncbi:hypothetical protein ACFFX1_17355 [Dactylosporangium sucinum]|uniref:Uncharacterized protein n=1 Tax=Dactylosporangium sucinum TaxID=1424081 RepID=A0A917X197_9ACTN|nr:hypothetical protein [Dactylosporangium sucinum]GGM57354.1 hypothetical protein GCM10007977_068750 [Dactylosporangium sucinum]
MTITGTTPGPRVPPIVPPGPGHRPLFSHPEPRPRGLLSDTTRRLCAAAYLDDAFAHLVIEETTGDDQRAVPPSFGFDLEPVVRHAFRARTMLMIRDAALTLILAAGLLLVPAATIAWLLLAWVIRRTKAGVRADARTGVALGAAVVLYACLGWLSPLFLMLGNAQQDTSAYGVPQESLATRVLGTYNTMLFVVVLALPFVLALATLAVALTTRLRRLLSLSRSLAPGAAEALPALPDRRVERRVAWLAAAQHGNVTLHSTEPFMGSGAPVQSWSMALLLQGNADSSERDRRFDLRTVSARDMQLRVSAAVLGLRSEQLPVHQRVPGVYVVDRVIADGERYQGDPLVDQRTRTPLGCASPEAIAAITEQPQGGVRHYLHAFVGVEGRAVTAADGRPVLPPQPQDIMISAHVHVAVEGAKLYLEFVGTVLPPVRKEYRVVDRIGPQVGPLVYRSLPRLPADWLASVDAPARLWRAFQLMRDMNQRARVAHSDAKLFRSYDHGARLSVRELAASPPEFTFLQTLDAVKYLKIVERTVLETVLDYLESVGVDTAEYRSRMTHIENHQTIFTGDTHITGPAAFGKGATAHQETRSASA